MERRGLPSTSISKNSSTSKRLMGQRWVWFANWRGAGGPPRENSARRTWLDTAAPSKNIRREFFKLLKWSSLFCEPTTNWTPSFWGNLLFVLEWSRRGPDVSLGGRPGRIGWPIQGILTLLLRLWYTWFWVCVWNGLISIARCGKQKGSFSKLVTPLPKFVARTNKRSRKRDSLRSWRTIFSWPWAFSVC